MRGTYNRSATSLVLAASLCLPLLLSTAQAQLIGPVISSNVEATAGTTSRGKATLPFGSGPVALPDDFAKLRLQPADTIFMDVFDVPLLSQQLAVDDAGNIIVPLLGPVHVAGDTLRQTEQRIAALLISQQVVKNPSVSLSLTSFARQAVTVSGEVQTPGKIQILAPRSLLDVIALAGGETQAAGGEVEVRHHNPLAPEVLEKVAYAGGKDATAAREAVVYPGDEVYVQRAGVVYVLGAVQRPGGYLMVNGGKLTVPQAIALALGTTLIASNKDVLIVRKRDGEITRITAPLKREETGKEPIVSLQDGDFLYIPTSRIKAILVNSQTVLASAASAGVVGALQR